MNNERFPGAMTTAMIDPGVRNTKMGRVLMSAIKEHIAQVGRPDITNNRVTITL